MSNECGWCSAHYAFVMSARRSDRELLACPAHLDDAVKKLRLLAGVIA